MPLNNYFYGVYNIASINASGLGATAYVITSLVPGVTMDAEPEFFMQGTILTKVLNIGHTQETLNVKAPILVSSDLNSTLNLKEGRALLNDLVLYKYGSNSNITLGAGFSALPVLQKASIHIGENESYIDFTLLSDGNPDNSTNVYTLQKGTNNLLNVVGLGVTAARVAKNWDFFVNLGGMNCFVQEATVDIELQTNNFNFLGSAGQGWQYTDVPYDGTHGGVWNPTTPEEIASYSGWQFPFIAVGGAKITASGKAAIALYNDNTSVNFGVSTTIAYDRASLLQRGNVTLQDTGMLSFGTGSFQFYMSVGSGTTTNVLPPAFTLNNALITQKTANFTPEFMTVDFHVIAFISG